MKKVVTVNLGGKAYQVEDDGYAILAGYLEQARARLHGNPDVDEILLDLELAIADRSEFFLNARKNVVTTREIERIVEEMGPVDVDDCRSDGEEPTYHAGGGERADAADAAGASSQPRKRRGRLYRLTGKHKMLAGVCAGLAARSGIDVSLVRIAFVALALVTSGLGVIAYFALALLLPSADAPLEAAESGGAPFNVREIVDGVHDRLHGVRAAWRRRLRETHRHRGHCGAYAYANHHGSERHRYRSGVLLRFGMLVAALVIGLYVVDQMRSPVVIPFGSPWFSPSIHAMRGPSPAFPALGLVLVLVAGFLLWRFARRRTTSVSSGRSFAAFPLKLLVALVVAWFAFQLIGGGPYISHRPYFYVSNASRLAQPPSAHRVAPHRLVAPLRADSSGVLAQLD